MRQIQALSPCIRAARSCGAACKFARACWALVRLGKEVWGDPAAEKEFQLEKGLLTDVLHARAEMAEALAPLGKKGVRICPVYILDS